MRRKSIWAVLLAGLTAVAAGCGGGDTPTGGGTPSGDVTRGGEGPSGATGTGKKALLIIASKDFQDLELKDTRSVLAGKGVTVTVASSTLDEVKGMDGATEKPAVLLTNAKAADYDAVVFIGGEGASEYFDNAAARTLAKEAQAAGKVVAAICIAPSVLANAGLLQGKKATCDYGQQKNLKDHGATLVEEDVVRDGRIVTANGPYAAKKFGEEIAKALTE